MKGKKMYVNRIRYAKAPSCFIAPFSLAIQKARNAECDISEFEDYQL